jgi:putative ABC transport system ATP-binding protein
MTLRVMLFRTLSRMSGLAVRFSIRGLRKSFAHGLARSATRTLAIANIDLDLHAGEILGVAGEAGSGKTTLLQCASGLLRPDAGSITLEPESHPRCASNSVAYIAPVPIYYPFLTARDVVAMRVAKMVERNAALERVSAAIDSLELKRVANDFVAMLSPDEITRLALAEAVVTGPCVIMLDTGVACPLRSPTFQRVIRRIAATVAPLVVASRDSVGLESVATRTIVLTNGRIADSRPASLFVAERMH